jgi:hypothetical protein
MPKRRYRVELYPKLVLSFEKQIMHCPVHALVAAYSAISAADSAFACTFASVEIPKDKAQTIAQNAFELSDFKNALAQCGHS